MVWSRSITVLATVLALVRASTATRAADASPVGGDSAPPAVDMSRIVGRADIHRTRVPGTGKPWIPLYQANGRFGGCAGPWGLHLRPGMKPAYPFRGVTVFTHLGHWVRAKYNADYLLPVATMYWEREPKDVQTYEQRQSLYDGTITTRFATPTWRASVMSWFDPVDRDVAGYRIDVEGDPPPIIVAPMRQLSVHYQQKLEASVEGAVDGQTWRAMIRCLNAKTPMVVRTSAELKTVDGNVQIALKPGRSDILISVGSELATTADASLKANLDGWHSTWARSGWLDLPDDAAHKFWVRGVAYTMYSHNDDGIGCSPPTGLAGNGWPFEFPFDSGCRHPLLLWTGQIDAARKWIEFYASKAAGLRSYTKRLWKLDGIMCPHVFPMGPADDYHSPELPNDNYAPIYLSGHLVRMADQTAVMVNDPAWTKRYAVPLIEGAAQFYLNMGRKGDDGLWHFSVMPSLGLDEDAERNRPDYYCTLVSAEYALQMAVAYGLDTDGGMKAILNDGIAYPSLLSPRGMYYAYGGAGERNLGNQKHPDQLAPIIHTPLGREVDAATRRGYELRYDITAGARQPRYTGHSLGELILANARMHDPQGWRREWESAQICHNADADWIQLYESADSSLSHYVTTHGLFAQSILETIVSTWWGRLDLAQCVPWAGPVRFGNIRTPLGVTVSGWLRDGKGEAQLKSWKDTTFRCDDQTITLKKGEHRVVSIGK